MVFFTGPCQHASHTARSRNCCFLQNEFSIYKICSDSGVHYVLACSAPAACLTCNTRQTSSSSPLPPWPGSADETVGISPRCSVPDRRDWGRKHSEFSPLLDFPLSLLRSSLLALRFSLNKRMQLLREKEYFKEVLSNEALRTRLCPCLSGDSQAPSLTLPLDVSEASEAINFVLKEKTS